MPLAIGIIGTGPRLAVPYCGPVDLILNPLLQGTSLRCIFRTTPIIVPIPSYRLCK